MKDSENKIRVFKDKDEWDRFFQKQKKVGELLELMRNEHLREIKTDEWHITRNIDSQPITIEELER